MKYLRIIGILFMLLLSIAYYNRDALGESLACSKSDEFRKMEYSGIVSKKIIDQENHRVRTITFKQDVGDVVLSRDTSQLYTFVNPGDSIVKKKNDDYVSLFRASKIYTFKIYFGCPN